MGESRRRRRANVMSEKEGLRRHAAARFEYQRQERHDANALLTTNPTFTCICQRPLQMIDSEVSCACGRRWYFAPAPEMTPYWRWRCSREL